MTFQEIILTLRRRFWLPVAGALMAGAVALILSLVWPPVYEAEALLLITRLRPAVTLDPRFQTVAEENVVNLSVQEEQVRRQTLVGLAGSHDLWIKVLERLGDSLPPDERSVDFMQGATDIRTEGNLIAFQARADRPAKAAAIANAWAETYQEQVNRLYSNTSPGYEQIQAQIANARTAYEAAQQELESFVRQSRENELTRQIEQRQQVLANLQAGQIAAARQQVDAFLARTNRINQLLFGARSLQTHLAALPAAEQLTPGEQFALFSLEAGAFTHWITLSLSLELGQGWLEQADVTVGQGAARLDRLIARLEADRTAAQAEIADRSLALLRGEELLAYGQDGATLEQIAALQAEIGRLQAELQQQQALKQDLMDACNLARENYLTLVRKGAEVQIASQLTGTEVQIAAVAHEPDEPAFPRPLLTTGLGIVAGGLAGLGLAFLLAAWPRRDQ